MRYVYDSKLLLAQIPDNLKEFFYLRFCQRCRRLVENNDFRFMGNRFCNFTHLLFADGQVSHHLRRVNIDIEPFKQFFRFFIHLFIIDTDTFLKLPADENILRYRQMPKHIQLLVYDNNTLVLRIPCIMEFHFLAFIYNAAGILCIDSCKNLHQS